MDEIVSCFMCSQNIATALYVFSMQISTPDVISRCIHGLLLHSYTRKHTHKHIHRHSRSSTVKLHSCWGTTLKDSLPCVVSLVYMCLFACLCICLCLCISLAGRILAMTLMFMCLTLCLCLSLSRIGSLVYIFAIP